MAYYRSVGYHKPGRCYMGFGDKDSFYVLKHPSYGFLKGIDPNILFTENLAFTLRFTSINHAERFAKEHGLLGFDLKKVHIVGQGVYKIVGLRYV